MKIFNSLSIILLLSFLIFVLFRVSTVSTYSYPEQNDNIMIDDGNVKSHWDDQNRHLNDMYFSS